jgi:hypothetical protein
VRSAERVERVAPHRAGDTLGVCGAFVQLWKRAPSCIHVDQRSKGGAPFRAAVSRAT